MAENKFAQNTQNRRAVLEQVKADAERVTRRRLEDENADFHREREAEVNSMEGVAEATPVREAALANPSEPGLANVDVSEGATNTHVVNNNNGVAKASKKA